MTWKAAASSECLPTGVRHFKGIISIIPAVANRRKLLRSWLKRYATARLKTWFENLISQRRRRGEESKADPQPPNSRRPSRWPRNGSQRNRIAVRGDPIDVCFGEDPMRAIGGQGRYPWSVE